MNLGKSSLLDAKLAREALNGPVAIVVTDALGCVSWCNASAESIFGTTSAKMLRQPIEPFFQQFESLPNLPDDIFAIKRGKDTECYVLHHLASRPIGQAHYFTKIDKLAAQWQAHQNQDAMWRFALDASGHAVWEFKTTKAGAPETKFYSENWRVMRGLSEEEMLTETPEKWLSRVHPDDLATTKNALALQDIGTISQISYEYRERHADGHYIWILARGRVQSRDSAGHPTHVVGVDVNITKLKDEEKQSADFAISLLKEHSAILDNVQNVSQAALESAKEAAERETLWRTAIEATGHGVWCYDIHRDGKDVITNVNFCSDAWYEMRGVEPGIKYFDDLEFWYQRVHPDDLENAIFNIDLQYNGTEDEVSFEYRERHSAGHWVWILVRGRTVERDAEGHPKRVIGIDIDISDVKAKAASNAEEAEYRHQIHVAELRSATILAEQAQAVAQSMARIDSQTKLANRHMFREDIATLIEKQTNFAVMIVDLDRFRKINDMHGHAAGDFVLKETAKRLNHIVGQNGTVARLGSDEFAIVLTYFEQDLTTAAHRLAGEIINQISAPFITGDLTLQLSATIGSSQYPRDGEDYEQLILHTDMALIKAKRGKRGVHVHYTVEMGEEASKRTKLENDLRTAIAEKQIQTWFQPIICAESNKVVKFEVLARWRHPLHGFVSPETFISMAEYLGLLTQLSADLLQQALECALNWDGIKLSFNMTAHEASDVQTPLRVLSTLSKTSFDPMRLEIEITEQAFLDDLRSAQTVVESLRRVGIKVYIDDFGEGYAGIGYLRDFEVDGIKFDRSCVTNICTKAAAANFLKSLQLMASNMNLETVAEGIETADVWEQVKQLGCSYGQGYLFSKALPAHEVLPFLAKHVANRPRLIA